MRRIGGVAVIAAGIAFACLVAGVGRAASCASGSAPVACLGGSVGSMGDLLRFAAVMVAALGGLLLATVVWQLRHHRQLVSVLNETASRVWLADHEVALVPGLHTPCVAGFARPQIYCPADLAERLEPGELRAVLLHERHHQLTYAPARLVVLAAIASAFGHVEFGRRWLERQRAAIEIAADDHALRYGVGRPELARALLAVGPARAETSLASYASASELRIRHLLGDASPHHRGAGSLAPFILPVIAFGACVVWGLVA